MQESSLEQDRARGMALMTPNGSPPRKKFLRPECTTAVSLIRKNVPDRRHDLSGLGLSGVIFDHLEAGRKMERES